MSTPWVPPRPRPLPLTLCAAAQRSRPTKLGAEEQVGSAADMGPGIVGLGAAAVACAGVGVGVQHSCSRIAAYKGFKRHVGLRFTRACLYGLGDHGRQKERTPGRCRTGFSQCTWGINETAHVRRLLLSGVSLAGGACPFKGNCSHALTHCTTWCLTGAVLAMRPRLPAAIR
jgi:hypothetical protein